MKKLALILLSYGYIAIGQGNATEHEGDIATLHHQQHSHAAFRNNHSPQTTAPQMMKHTDTKATNFIKEITDRYHTKDTRKLDEISDTAFDNQNYGEAADTAIVAAILGHSDSQAFIVDIAPESVKYLTSKDPQSEDALKYYNSTLREKVREYFSKQ